MFFANWFADFGMNEISQQWRCPQGPPPDASGTSCCPIECRTHGEAEHRSAQGQNYRPANSSYTSAAATLPVQSLNNIVGSDAGPVFIGKVTVGQGFLNTGLNSFYRPLQFHGKEFLQHSPSLFSGSSFALLGVDRLKHLGHLLHIAARCH